MRTAAKAIVGAAIAGLTAVGVALGDGVITSSEWVTVALAVIVAGNGVYWTPNGSDASSDDGI